MSARTKVLNDRTTLFALVTLAFVVRMLRLGLSLWSDETISIFGASRPLWLVDRFVIGEASHPPAHYYLLHAWFALLGPGIIRARWLSVVFGVAAIPVLYLLGRYLFDRTTGLIAALALSLAPLPVIYAQVARPYSMHLFLSLCATYLFAVAVRERSQKYWWGFVACAALTIYTLYYGVFVVVALAASLLWLRKRHPIPVAWALGGAALIGAVYIPWLMHSMIPNLRSRGHFHLTGVVPGLPVHWYTPVTIINIFNSSPHDPSPLWSVAVGGVLFTLPAIFGLRVFRARTDRRPDRESLVFVLILSVLPIICVLSLGIFLHVQFQHRYILFAAPYYYLFVAYGIRSLTDAWRAPVLAAIVLYSSLALIDHSYWHPDNSGTRDALAVLAKGERAGDCAIFDGLQSILLQWNNYYGALPFRTIRWTGQMPDLEGCQRVWVVELNPNRWRQLRPLLTEQAQLREEKILYKTRVVLFQLRRKTEVLGAAQD